MGLSCAQLGNERPVDLDGVEWKIPHRLRYDRLGTICEARGDDRKAADCYRKAIGVIRN